MTLKYLAHPIKALSENNVLTKRGVGHAKVVALELAERNLGQLTYDGTQIFFEISTGELKTQITQLGIEEEVQ